MTLWLILFLYIYYKRKFEQMKLTNHLLPQDTLTSSGLLWSWQSWSFLPEAAMFAVRRAARPLKPPHSRRLACTPFCGAQP